MAYLFRIGEPEIDFSSGAPKLIVPQREVIGAPEGRPGFGHSNTVAYPYQEFDDTVRATGLYELFYNGCGLLRKYPGSSSFGIRERDLVVIALQEWSDLPEETQALFPRAKPFLQWLVWWMNYAMAHCNSPSFYSC